MRFGAPRSPSTSPERRQYRGKSSYGLYVDSEPESDGYDILDEESDTDSVESLESSSRLSNLRVGRPEQKTSRRPTTDAEMRYIEDTIAAIRLRTRHQDPYEKWEQETRKDAFRTAKKTLTRSQSLWHDERDKARVADLERLSTLHAQQTAEVQGYLNALRQQQQKEELKLKERWKARDQLLWQRIESVIKMEEDRAMKLEEDRRIRQEAETRRRLEEEKKRMEEEKKREEEEKKKREEEEARKHKEEKERRETEEKHREERARLERQKAGEGQRQSLGLSTADEDWHHSRSTLHRLKTEVMKVVKANKELKKQWGDLRRQITPRIGQLTNDDQSIVRISKQLIQICKPSDAPLQPRILYHALLSSLAKAIILQAETEVTAEVRTAEPLSKVTVNLLGHLEDFSTIFYARIIQRVGGWAVPIVVPTVDFDGRPWQDKEERLKVMGYRKGATGEETETTAEYCTRIAGIMRIYFYILKIRPPRGPLWPVFQTPRCWVWFARIVGEQHRALLESPAAAYLIHTALDVMGTEARNIWGLQWVKMLALIYEGVTEGLANGDNGEKFFIGGQKPEGKSARMRVRLGVERIMADASATGGVVAGPTVFS